jgi:ATP-dependent helicase HrpB
VSPGLPVEEALGPLRAALGQHGAAVLEAPPGAGKSTLVPLALLGEQWLQGQRLLMLEPRRLAARTVAERMAQTLGEEVGASVGYRTRLDTRVSRATRIEVLTEGILTRRLQHDPALEGVALVIFDEFHERSLQADLGLAFTLDARRHLKPALRVLVMSATLEAASVARLLDDAPVVSARGRAFPVSTHYAGRGLPLLPGEGAHGESPERRVLALIRRALPETEGDLLVFLPGAGEIRRVAAQLEDAAAEDVTVLPLYGDLSTEAQHAALAPAARGVRKVVLATNIAETSLTIPGVRVVIDSGLARRARFDPVTGMGRLETTRISRASAQQRAGRAGRTAPGACYRAWSEGAQDSLAPYTAPEILEADLAPLALELASWGTQDPRELAWLDAPPAAMLASARDLLARLGALSADGRVSEHGREMARLAVHPRLAHMLLAARPLGLLRSACELAALLSERDLLRGSEAQRDADVRTRLELLRGEEGGAGAVDRAALARARRLARELERQLQADARRRTPAADEASGLLLAFAYPERIAQRRASGAGRYTLANGRGAAFAQAQPLSRAELIVAAELDDRERDARILLAAPLTRADLEEYFAGELVAGESVAWDPREQAVIGRRTVTLGALVLEDKPLTRPAPEATRAALLSGVRELGLAALPWTPEARELLQRIEFVRASSGSAAADWPPSGEAELLASLDSWLAPYLEGLTRREHLARVPLVEALRARLTFAQQRQLEEWAPSHVAVPSGSRIRVDYLDPGSPAVSVRLQEVFGLAATPLLGRGRVPLTFRLLSPAQRPVQVTRDLASFWRGAYAEVRKDLRGRYPKHHWPEDPLTAAPTRGARRRR